MNAKSTLFIFALGLLPLAAQQSLESAYRTTGTAVVAAFEVQRQVLQTSSAVMHDGRSDISYGVVISSDGYLLTKASEIAEATRLGVTVDQTKYPAPKVLMVDPAWDVALVKIDAQGLIPVVFAPTSAVPQGTWVVANGASTRTTRRLLAGIVSANIREIPADGGAALGVVMNPKAKNLEIAEVNEKSGAKDAGLQKGDIITAIGGKKLKKLEDVAAALKDLKIGSIISLTYQRKKVETTVDVRLSARGELFTDQMDRNDAMSGRYSPRRSGFPRVMQHDILGNREVVGGPLLDLDGRCIGMNIARANRAESFAIPVEDLRDLADRLMKQAAGAN